MSTIPTSVTEKQFNEHIRPHLTTAKRGYECKIPLYKVFNYILYRLHTGCQWQRLSIDPDADDLRKKEISYSAVYLHFAKWSRDGSLKKVWHIQNDLNLSELNLDGTHAIAKKGGEAVAYQGRKKCKTSNMLILSDSKGIPIACSEPISGNHNDAFELTKNFDSMVASLKLSNIRVDGLFLNADAGFDTISFRNCLFKHDIFDNIDNNSRNGKNDVSFLDESLYKERFVIERTNAWLDAFKAILVRFETKNLTGKH